MSGHLVELIDVTGAVVVRCRTCPWTVTVGDPDGPPLPFDAYADTRLRAKVEAEAHAYYAGARHG